MITPLFPIYAIKIPPRIPTENYVVNNVEGGGCGNGISGGEPLNNFTARIIYVDRPPPTLYGQQALDRLYGRGHDIGNTRGEGGGG